MNLGQHLRASECLREAIASDPSKIEPRTNLGGCLVELHQPQAAVDLLLSALRLSPQNSAALANLGSAYRLLGDFPKAESVALQTIQIAPHWFVGYLNLGSVLVQLGRNQEAITHFRKAFELNPDSQTALSNLIFCLNYEEDVSPEQVFA
jgi:tetratricopeptide (TPR) repeat protein